VYRRVTRVRAKTSPVRGALRHLSGGAPQAADRGALCLCSHAVWATKKLRRGELFIAKSCCDNTMKRLLRQMIEWHARATHGWDYDTWYDGRFLHQWADPRTAAGLREADAHYDADDVRRALFATTDLFRRRG